MIPQAVLDQFQFQGPVEALTDGRQPVYKVQGAVLKRVDETEFENQHSLALAPWLGEQLNLIL